jgi:ATP-binding cassette subfamily B (MDR/TAP) protein 1
VSFAYPTKKEVPILHDVSLKIPKNNVVALVGASGCGKSSIISLIERWYDPILGKFSYNGVDLQDIDNTWYHQSQVAIVQQEPILFSNSIKDNILYGIPLEGKTEEQITEMLETACKDAYCLDFIMDKDIFPEGFDTVVGERGVRLSGGQKQRVAIARALIRNP